MEYLVINSKMLNYTVAGGFIAKCNVWYVQLYYKETWHIPKSQAMLAGGQGKQNSRLSHHTHRRVLIITDVFISAPNHSLDKHSALRDTDKGGDKE